MSATSSGTHYFLIGGELVTIAVATGETPTQIGELLDTAIAANQSGNAEKATLYFKQLIELTKDSNSNRSEITEANGPFTPYDSCLVNFLVAKSKL